MKIRFVILFFLPLCFGYSQNLVPNGSFEKYGECPENYSSTQYLKHVSLWESPNSGTPDYFNECSYKCGVPLNWVGSAEAFDGKAYMGIIGCMKQIDPHQIAYREYIKVELNDTLKKGVTYYASMQVRLGLSCSLGCAGLGMLFTDSPMLSNKTINYPVTPNVSDNGIGIVLDKDRWTKICGKFEAVGGERFLVIGNFLSNQDMEYENLDENFIETRFISPMAYYYIDYVQVVEYNDSINFECENAESLTPIAFEGNLDVKTKMVLNNLYFKTDEAVILKESYFELDKLAYELKKNNRIKIAIYGHTDNTGTEDYNLKLSNDRAMAVRRYLIEKGVSKFRITAKGFGYTQPISNNESEKGKQLNRRVEIEVQ